MFKRHFILGMFAFVAAAAVLSFGAVSANADEDGNKRASISFADLGGIKDWRAYNNDTLYVESLQGQWYKATFFGPCFELPFAESIAFVTEPDGSLDKFSSILVHGDRCHFRTFEESEKPSKSDAD